MGLYEDAEGVRRSDLWVINKTPMHFLYHMNHKDEKDSKALAFGIAAHMAILDAKQYIDSYLVMPNNIDRRTKEGKRRYTNIMDHAADTGKTIMSEDDFDIINEMRHAIMRDPLAYSLLQGEHEQEFYWVDDMTGEKCKCKVDCVTDYQGKPYIVDYKTTDSCEDGAFERSAQKYGYQFQAGMYCEGLFQSTFTEHGFAFVAQEKKPPYAVRVYICDPEWIKRGYDKFRELIGIYHYCKESGNWYGYEGAEGVPVELVEG